MEIKIKGLTLETIGILDERLGYNWREGFIEDNADGLHDAIVNDCVLEFPDNRIVVMRTVNEDGSLNMVTLFNTLFTEIEIV